ncbi:MAG: hypothetical protein V6Z81_10845 [Parvularculales bacterium]
MSITPPGLTAEQKAKVNGIGNLNGIGQTATLCLASGGAGINPGQTYSGSALRYNGAVTSSPSFSSTLRTCNNGITPQGTWRATCDSDNGYGGNYRAMGTFVRID